MLEIFYGNNHGVVRSAVQDVLQALPADTEVAYIEAEAFLPGQLTEAMHGSSLFAAPYVYVLDTPSANAEYQSEVLANVSDLAESSHRFLILENQLKAVEKKTFAKHTDSITDCSIVLAKRPDAFAMTNCLCERNKRRLWLELQTARRGGLRPEEIIGTLWWQLKTLRLAAITSSASEAGMKEYPYKKAKQALRAFSLAEVEQLSTKLLQVYHDGHAGVRDIDLALEEWVLTV